MRGAGGRARQEFGLVEHAVLDEHGHLGAHRERDGVRRTRVELHLLAGRVEDNGGVVDPALEIRDDHAGDRDLEAAEERQEEIVGQRARRDAVLERVDDTGRLRGANRHPESLAVALALEDKGGLEARGIEEEPDHAGLLRARGRGRLRGEMRGRRGERGGHEERQSDVRHPCELRHPHPPPGRLRPERASSIGPGPGQVKSRGAL